MEFKDKFIGFLDILGFKKMVESAEAGSGTSLQDLLKLTKLLGSPDDIANIDKYGPTICPQSKYTQRALDFQITQISDCMIVSAEVSSAGVINLINHCWSAVVRLLKEGIMCRGYITRGTIYHAEGQVIGSGYQKAYSMEASVSAFKHAADERGTPFVEVDPIVCDFIEECGDKCVREMFSRFTKSDGAVTAIFPFQRLSHSFIVGDFVGLNQKFDPEKEKRSNQVMRQSIQTLIERLKTFVDAANPDAIRKSQHYIEALDRQIAVCDQTDKIIDELCSPFLRRRLQ